MSQLYSYEDNERHERCNHNNKMICDIIQLLQIEFSIILLLGMTDGLEFSAVNVSKVFQILNRILTDSYFSI